MKKKFKDTKVGKFLMSAAPHIFNLTSTLLPSKGILSVVKGLIQKDDILTPLDKESALKLLEIDMIEMQEVSKRWSSDMSSDSWLSKNVRPIILIFFSVSYIVGWYLEYPLTSVTSLLSLIVGAYFGGRSAEKVMSIKNHN